MEGLDVFQEHWPLHERRVCCSVEGILRSPTLNPCRLHSLPFENYQRRHHLAGRIDRGCHPNILAIVRSFRADNLLSLLGDRLLSLGGNDVHTQAVGERGARELQVQVLQ